MAAYHITQTIMRAPGYISAVPAFAATMVKQIDILVNDFAELSQGFVPNRGNRECHQEVLEAVLLLCSQTTLVKAV